MTLTSKTSFWAIDKTHNLLSCSWKCEKVVSVRFRKMSNFDNRGTGDYHLRTPQSELCLYTCPNIGRAFELRELFQFLWKFWAFPCIPIRSVVQNWHPFILKLQHQKHHSWLVNAKLCALASFSLFLPFLWLFDENWTYRDTWKSWKFSEKLK